MRLRGPPPPRARAGAIAARQQRLRNCSVPTSRGSKSVISIPGQFAIEDGPAPLVQDVGVQAPRKQVDAGVKPVLTGVETPGVFNPRGDGPT